jgi:flagellar protein FlaJ
MYALSRGGMPLPRILRTLADTEAVYGAAAAEFGVVVREMDAVGTDVISALEARGQRTPSDGFAELCETLGTVHGSNEALADYLHAQHKRSREAAATDQEQSLDYLSVVAEGYVTGLVVGPLFVLTTLTLVGLAITDTRPVIRLLVFVVVPLLTAGFLAVIERLRTARERPGDPQRERNTPTHRSVTADGESADGHSADQWATQRATLRLYDRLGCGGHWLRQPRATLLANPWLTWLVTLPAGIVWLAVTVQAPSLTLTGLLSSLVGPASLVAVGGCVCYAAVYELAAARRRRIEAAAPELLDRLCSLTDAGLPIVDALQRVADTELGAVTPMIQQAWHDVGWGATVETALRRFATRARSPRLTRAITLVRTASRVSGDIAPVVSIAATELRASRRRDRDRRRLVATYVLVIYIGFLVFVGILVALSATFLPVITAQTTAAAAVGTDTALAADPASAVGTDGHSPVQSLAGYRSLFFQTAAVQAVCSGVVAGKLANGTVRGGAKHVAALLVVAHVAFQFV